MGYYNSTITFGGLTLYIKDAHVSKVPATIKQIVGKKIIKHSSPGRNMYDYEISFTGIMFGDDKDTQRTNLETYWDGEEHALVDGQHDGDYLIEDISFNDSGNNPTTHEYTLQLTQYKQ